MANNLFTEPKDNTGVWKVGTSGWSYPPSTGPGSWTGVFYPLTKTDELKFYSRYFNAVEVNSTFYHPCTPKMAEGWVKRTPEDFEFAVKAWQQFTHNEALWTAADIEVFTAGIHPLAEAKKLGCLLFQFPASFRASETTIDKLKELLEGFISFPKAVELRHRSWEEHLAMLNEFNATPAFIDEPKFETSIQQQIEAFGGVLYMRFHGRKFDKWWKHEHRNERYDYLYTPEEIRPYAVRLKETSMEKGLKRAYTFFNNHPGANAVANAVMLRAELDIPVTADLPDRLTEAFPGLQARGLPRAVTGACEKHP